MKKLKIYARGGSIHNHVRTSLQRFIRYAGLQLEIEDISDVELISAINAPALPYMMMEGSEGIHLQPEESAEDYCKRARKWIVVSEGSGSLDTAVVPIDFSEPSLNALQYVMTQYKGKEAVIQIISCHIEVVSDLNGVPVVDTSTLNLLRERMKDLVADLEADVDCQGLIVQGEIIIGPTIPCILEVSEKNEKSVIYMGSSGATGILKRLIGSTTQKLVKRAKKPLFIIPPTFKHSLWKNVAVAVADPESDLPIIDRLYQIVGEYNPTLHLIHCDTEREQFEFSAYSTRENKFPSNLIKTKELYDEDVWQSIVNYLKEEHIQLLVMSHYKRTMLEAFMHHSMTLDVVKHIKSPILIINPRKRESSNNSSEGSIANHA